MWLTKPNAVPSSVIAQYGPVFEELSWSSVSGGFSGAKVWRGDDAQGMPRFALKQWPAEMSVERLDQIHNWMSEAAHLPFVPSLFSTVEGKAISQHDDSVWDATKWLPGHTCIPAGIKEVENACEAVSEIHRVWSRYTNRAPSPGVQRRIEVLSQWLVNPRTTFSTFPPSLSDLIRRAVNEVERTVPIAREALIPWANVPQLLQPCIRDLRAEHVLFEDARVTGIVDYGAMAVDSPAFDLSRLLGDLVDDNEELFAHGLKKYRECRTAFDCGDRFVRLLDRVGIVCSLMGWLARLSGKSLSHPLENIANRLLHLIVRAEQIESI
jgi:Ser/Thr protein kinase RdoA (MazF antagonist)